MELKGKKLLILGGTYASYNLVKTAKEMGIYTIVADYNESGVAKEIADEQVVISTTDYEKLVELIREREIDGVFCGPSEFNIRNMIRLAEMADLPCYASMQLWDQCANKDEFTSWCRQYGVDVPEEYDIHSDMTEQELSEIEYPIIIKPVDGSSSVGISVCQCDEEVMPAFEKAMEASSCKRVIAERYIDNGGEIFGARYLVQDGEAFPYLLIDTYVVDPFKRTSLISAFTLTPSKYSDYYLREMDDKVCAMIKGMGIRNGTVFFQSLPYKGRIFFHEMGYRLSGGLIYKLTEPLMGINDMKMMVRYALGGECITKEEIDKIDLRCHGKIGAQLMIPLKVGTIGRVEGLDQVINLPDVTDFIQYYYVGDTIKERFIGTLQQHFGRFTLICDDEDAVVSRVQNIQKALRVFDVSGKEQNYMLFDCTRLKDNTAKEEERMPRVNKSVTTGGGDNLLIVIYSENNACLNERGLALCA